MAINFDRAFGLHADALVLRSQRAGVLAANLANADTPGFKARDFDFRAALANATGDADGADAGALRRTNAAHLDAGGNRADQGDAGTPPLAFRVSTQPSIDGNSVDTQTERAQFTENAVRYQASLNLLQARIKGLRTALRGE